MITRLRRRLFRVGGAMSNTGYQVSGKIHGKRHEQYGCEQHQERSMAAHAGFSSRYFPEEPYDQ